MVKKLFVTVFLITLFPFFSMCDDSSSGKCGNGEQDEGEECDPLIPMYTGICTDDCKLLEYCGNGILEGNEECDDGNVGSNDGCNSICLVETGCGNGVIDFTFGENGGLLIEECDDDNIVSGDGCSSECKVEQAISCGNGILEFPEDCDDGNSESGDGCSSECKVESGCGDGIIDAPLELCDDGNRIKGDGCDENCRVEFVCGDLECDTENGESCEVCQKDCCPNCGDGFLDDDEECDDGNNDRFDGCGSGCHDEDGVSICGNGIWETGEDCDDSNTEDGDGCSSSCEREYELNDQNCESDKGENCQNSPFDCCPGCGNGVIDFGEECDGSVLNGNTCENNCYDGGVISCTSYCTLNFAACTGSGPLCGNSVAECSEQCDTGDFKGKTCETFGFESGSLGCSEDCTVDISGCSGFMFYLYSIFVEDSTPDGWDINGDFQIGTPSSGPAECYSPPYCAGTNLSGYYSSSTSYSGTNVILPEIDLTGAVAPYLSFYSWIYAESGFDGGKVQISLDGGVSFDDVDSSALSVPYDDTEGWTGTKTTWELYTVDLSDYIGSSIVIRFGFMSDSYTEYSGWYIDDITVSEM
ncbi:MAG: DUF4215 domain-containing protein [Deltaproteobacteria bacterium]|nr:DUF4215 domain-containing protein [Deltaproteobacteria bacterium]